MYIIIQMPPSLQNFGNTCYLNAAAQLILASESLKTAILADYSQTCVYVALANFLAIPSSSSLQAFTQTFRHVKSAYNNSCQQDSAEFLSNLLQLLRQPFTNANIYQQFCFSGNSELKVYADYCSQRDWSNITTCISFYMY